MTMRLDISVGPVQGFVAQSRRTRDLWGSSYLLSFLCAHAIQGAQQAGGRVVQPQITGDQLFNWVTGKREGEPPTIGSVPNHFVVHIEDEPEVRDVAKAAEQALATAWKRVCVAVWEGFVANASRFGEGTEAIWQRQVEGFWEVIWTAGPDAKVNQLARRKRWRTHRLPEEGGDKCSVMHDLQELSGFVRAQGGRSQQRQDDFWQAVAKRLGPLDLEQRRERLCAIALVKRLLPKVSKEALGWQVDAQHWPSTLAVAARPWVRKAAELAPNQAHQYTKALRQAGGPNLFSERPTTSLSPLQAQRFETLDANYFHLAYLDDPRRCPLTNGDDEAEGKIRKELGALLKEVYRGNRNGSSPGEPPTFYALLLADGDHLGRLLGSLGGEAVGNALAEFTKAVQPIVTKHQGVTIYAGGDDVLSMLPVEDALPCANALADCYRRSFGNEHPQATLSAAVLFAQMRVPLRTVLTEAHRLLDEQAKEGNGRNSLAAAVHKPGALHCLWTTTWTRNGTGATDALDALTTHLARSDEAHPSLSSSLLYRVRETLTRIGAQPNWTPGTWFHLPSDIDTGALLRSEILHSLSVRMAAGADKLADELAQAVRLLMQPARNEQRTGDAESSAEAGLDALLLARFLSRRGQEDGSQ